MREVITRVLPVPAPATTTSGPSPDARRLSVREAARLYPGRVAVALDAREGRVAVEGWAEASELSDSHEELDGSDFCPAHGTYHPTRSGTSPSIGASIFTRT